jgi:hypothetical protein
MTFAQQIIVSFYVTLAVLGLGAVALWSLWGAARRSVRRERRHARHVKETWIP